MTEIPSLYLLAAEALMTRRPYDYYFPSSTPKSQQLREMVLEDDVDLVLERRPSSDEDRYLSRPARYNPMQWRVAYLKADTAPFTGNAAIIYGPNIPPNVLWIGEYRVCALCRALWAVQPRSATAIEQNWINMADAMDLPLPYEWRDDLGGYEDFERLNDMIAAETDLNDGIHMFHTDRSTSRKRRRHSFDL